MNEEMMMESWDMETDTYIELPPDTENNSDGHSKPEILNDIQKIQTNPEHNDMKFEHHSLEELNVRLQDLAMKEFEDNLLPQETEESRVAHLDSLRMKNEKNLQTHTEPVTSQSDDKPTKSSTESYEASLTEFERAQIRTGARPKQRPAKAPKTKRQSRDKFRRNDKPRYYEMHHQSASSVACQKDPPTEIQTIYPIEVIDDDDDFDYAPSYSDDIVLVMLPDTGYAVPYSRRLLETSGYQVTNTQGPSPSVVNLTLPVTNTTPTTYSNATITDQEESENPRQFRKATDFLVRYSEDRAKEENSQSASWRLRSMLSKSTETQGHMLPEISESNSPQPGSSQPGSQLFVSPSATPLPETFSEFQHHNELPDLKRPIPIRTAISQETPEEAESLSQ